MVQAPTHQIPGVYHRRIGDIIVTALSDGYLDGTVDVLQNITPDDAMRILNENFRPGRRTSVNCYAIFSAGRLALVETGSGDYLLPTAGKLQQNLAAAGIDPAAIERVLLTHMHPDHSAGLTDPKSGRKLFPNDELVVPENEPRHWNDDTTMAMASERAKKLYFQCAREQMAPYHNMMHTFSGGVDVFPGVTSVPLHGHTPGPQRLHDIIGQGFSADLGRHCACAGHSDTPPRGDDRVRYRSARCSGNAKAGARHGGDRSAARCRNACALSRLCTCAKARGQLSHVA